MNTKEFAEKLKVNIGKVIKGMETVDKIATSTIKAAKRSPFLFFGRFGFLACKSADR